MAFREVGKKVKERAKKWNSIRVISFRLDKYGLTKGEDDVDVDEK